MSDATDRNHNERNRAEATETAGIQPAEAKRRAARRRFLLGGAAAVPVIVTLGQKEAWAASAAVCQSMGLDFGKGFTTKDHDQLSNKELAASVYCRP